MANATRSRSSSPVQRKARRLNDQKFIRAYNECLVKGLGVKDCAHILGWHVDEVLRMIGETNRLLSICEQPSMDPLRGM